MQQKWEDRANTFVHGALPKPPVLAQAPEALQETLVAASGSTLSDWNEKEKAIRDKVEEQVATPDRTLRSWSPPPTIAPRPPPSDFGRQEPASVAGALGAQAFGKRRKVQERSNEVPVEEPKASRPISSKHDGWNLLKWWQGPDSNKVFEQILATIIHVHVQTYLQEKLMMLQCSFNSKMMVLRPQTITSLPFVTFLHFLRNIKTDQMLFLLLYGYCSHAKYTSV